MARTLQLIFWALFIGLSFSTCPFLNVDSSIPVTSAKFSSYSVEFTNVTSVQPGMLTTSTFTNESYSHTWELKNIDQGQVVYVSIAPEDNIKLELFRPSGQSYTSIVQRTPSTSSKYLTSWISPDDGDWIIRLNDTRETRSDNVTYSLLVMIPSSGFSVETAVLVTDSPYLANFTIDHESHYWKVLLNENQNGIINLRVSDPFVLFGSTISIFREQNPQNPILELTTITQVNFNHSWNAPATDTYFVVVKHQSDAGYIIGEYNISFSAETSAYNFETAQEIEENQTLVVKVIQGFIPRKRYYFSFNVNVSRSDVSISVYEANFTTSTILNYAVVELFDEGIQHAKLTKLETEEDRDGQINISETLDEGTYYLVVTPESNAVGTFYILLEYRLPRPFIWNLPVILFSIGITVMLPLYLVYLDTKGKFYRVNQWTTPTSVQETYRTFRNSFRGIYNIKEVPDDSILIRVASIPFHTHAILNFVESSEKETLVISKRICRKYELGQYFLFSLIIFDVLNIVSYILFSIHFLPFYVTSLTSILIFLFIPTVVLVIIVLFTNVSAYITYSQVINRITYIVQNYQENDNKKSIISSMDALQAAKSINYVRVLWNQARHAFKDQNYELFVIKADASVKNLLSTRYMQICPENMYSKPDFQTQVVELRKRGFDLPNDRRIAHFRNLRNRIVHSSVTLNEKESVDCFAFYSTFITRLGLRPT
ncbi:MAG: hypothetical protein ACTSRJ_06795 [Candidatus Hodarchaeales archaeon]